MLFPAKLCLDDNRRLEECLSDFMNCQAGFQAAYILDFDSSIPRNKMNIILKVKDCISKLKDSNKRIEVHSVLEHKDKESDFLQWYV